MKNLIKEKNDFRQFVKNLSFQHKKDDFSIEDSKIVESIIESEVYKKSSTILAYYPLNNEVNIKPLINRALFDNKIVALPKTEKNNMFFLKINKNWEKEIKKGQFSIKEPISTLVIDNFKNDTLIIVPNLALGKDNTRIGHGKGFYDKFLSTNSNINSLGICRKIYLFDSIPTEKNDIILNQIISSK